MSAVAAPPRRFGPYEIVRKLGRSMTDVYLAYDPRMNRQVILKIIENSNDDFTRLVIEAERRGAQIQRDLHRIDPRILEVYDCSEAENSFFVAMEFFDGRNIAEILRTERRLDPKRAARYAAETCSQLDRLHQFVSDLDGKKRAVVHGDIKPSNIQIGPNDELRLLDFGIAKVITYTRSLTQHNLGSPTYCSPERLAKGQVDAQADLWALGVSLYEMLAGSPPYQAQDTRKLENLIQSKRPPRSLPESCPEPLRAIVSKALAPEIDRRYADAKAFEADLRAFVENRPTIAASEHKPAWGSNTTVQNLRTEVVKPRRTPRAIQQMRRFPWLKLGAVLFAVATIFLGFYLFGRVRDQITGARNTLDYRTASIADINADWQRFRALADKDAFLGRFSPALYRSRSLRVELMNTADDVIDEYRNSSDEALEDFDWAKAQVCLRHALEIDPADRAALSKAALVDGFLNLMQNPALPKALPSEASFRRAASLAPKSPEPHLGLARFYIYVLGNVGRALAELHQAERLGFMPGPREAEEQADGYLLRAESELRSHTLRLASGDLDRARALYEPIIGFSHVDDDLKRLDQDETVAAKLNAPAAPIHAAPASKKKEAAKKRWR